MPLVASENYKLALPTITDQNSGLIQRFTDIRLHSYNLDTQDFTSAWNPATHTYSDKVWPATNNRRKDQQQSAAKSVQIKQQSLCDDWNI